MTGHELFNKYIANRGKAGSKESAYAQLLMTLSYNLGGDVLYDLLEKAEIKNKRLDVVDNGKMFFDSILIEDVIFC